MSILSVIIEAIALITAGTMVGNELAVAVLVHPKLHKLDNKTHTRSAKALARVFGRVMPFWYAATLALNIAVILIARVSWTLSWWLACISAALFAISIGYTIFSLVPINNSISSWDINALPPDWQEQRRQWDQLHRIRVAVLLVALAVFVTSTLL